MTRLYELTQSYAHLESLIESNEGSETLIKSLDAIEGIWNEKAKDVAAFVRNLETTAQAIKEAEGRMAERRKAIENRVEAVKKYLLDNMLFVGIEKIECPLFKISVRNNPPRVVVDDESLIPPEYMVTPEPPKPYPDKKKIMADIKQGVVIDGVHSEQDKSIVIK